jgi:hypothetical protein
MVKKNNKRPLSCPEIFIIFIAICMGIICIKETVSDSFYSLIKNQNFLNKNSIKESIIYKSIELENKNILIIINSINEQLKYESNINLNNILNQTINIENYEKDSEDFDI